VTVIRELEHVTSKFLIQSAEKVDSGRYECQASNPFGKSYYHIQLQIWGQLTFLQTFFNYKLAIFDLRQRNSVNPFIRPCLNKH